MWDVLVHIYIYNIFISFSFYVSECPPGYYLKNCSKQCSTPYYGDKCQSVCQCPDVYCHFAKGCSQHVNSYNSYQPQGILIQMEINHLSNYISLTLYKNGL